MTGALWLAPMMSVKTLSLLALASLASGCASVPEGEYPSLAIRDVERAEGTMEPAAPVEPPQAPAARVSDAAGLLAEAQEAHRAFEAALPAADRIIRAGRSAGPGADSWGRAQVALADLESHRSRLMVALADLDRLYVATTTEGLAPGEIASAREAAQALERQETDTLEQFQGMLAG